MLNPQLLRPRRKFLHSFLEPVTALLDLVRSRRFNARDIPAGAIVSSVGNYVKLGRDGDVAQIGEFAVLTSTLILLKSRQLTPWLTDKAPLTDEFETPSLHSAARLSQQGPVIQTLTARFSNGMETFSRIDYAEPVPREPVSVPISATVLVRAAEAQYAEVATRHVDRLPPPIFLRIEMATQSLQRSLRQLRFVSLRGVIRTGSLDRRTTVVYFLAILELARKRSVEIVQTHPFDDIVIAPFRTRSKGSSVGGSEAG